MKEEAEYFQEIEGYFLQKRANPHLLSPREWSLIQEWFEAGIPEEIVLRAIDTGFERKKEEERTPVSLTYFRRLVKAEHKRYLKSLEGVTGGVVPAPEAKNVREFLEQLIALLETSSGKARAGGNTALGDLLEKSRKQLDGEILKQFQENQTVNLERVESQLNNLEKEIEQVLLQTISEEQMRTWKEDAMRELKMFEQKVELSVYQEMINRAVIKAVRKVYNIPRLSLFYM